MTHAVCTVPIAPLRKFADHTAEMVSQLLFGEYCTITEAGNNGFVKVMVAYDGYEGWCQQQHLLTLVNDVFNNPIAVKLAADWVNAVQINGTVMYVPFGSTLITDAYSTRVEAVSNFLPDNSSAGKWVNITAPDMAKEAQAEAIKKIAFTFLNTPYLWGGRSVFGTDCSGFTQMVYKFFGIALLRDARQQATQGVTVDFLQQAVCGDLAFFDNAAGEIIHVGLLLSSNEILHASGKIQVDDIDNGGIINRATGQRTQKLRIIKRYF